MGDFESQRAKTMRTHTVFVAIKARVLPIGSINSVIMLHRKHNTSKPQTSSLATTDCTSADPEADPEVGTGDVLDALVADDEELLDVVVSAVMRVIPPYAVPLGNMVGGSVSISSEVTVRSDHVDGTTTLAPDRMMEATPVEVEDGDDDDDNVVIVEDTI